MNVTTNLTPTTVQGFNGLYSRGSVDTCPPDHLTDCFNCIFPGKSQVDLREPTTIQSAVQANTISFFVSIQPTQPVLLTLNSTGNLRDETRGVDLGNMATLGVPPDDMFGINIFGRTYLTFMLNGKALPGGLLRCYYHSVLNGYMLTTLPALGAGVAPALASQNPGGNVDVGTHQVSYAYLNERGFLSHPSSILAVVAPGAQDIVINIPTSPDPTVTSKVVLMSLANQLELFFVPGGTIPNATATFTINVHDTALIASADYLNNLMNSLPAGASLAFYNGRLVIIGQDKFPDDIIFSDVGNPESFNAVTSVVHMPVDYGINTSNGSMIIRDVLYITKPNSTYAVQDNGNTPFSWGVTIMDSGIGAWQTGISTFASSMSGQDILDTSLVANERGLMIFNGTYSSDILTYKIETLWRTIDPNYFSLVQITHDVWQKRIYIAVPLDYIGLLTKSWQSQNINKMILMGDYQEGLDSQHIKWSTWTTKSIPVITKIAVENFTLTYANAMIYQLAIVGKSDTIYKIVPNDDAPDIGGSIFQMITTAPITLGKGQIYIYTMINLSVAGIGLMSIKLWGKSKGFSAVVKGFNLSAYTKFVDLQRGINLTSESMLIQLTCDLTIPGGLQGRITLDGMEVYSKRIWGMRPALTQSS